ncbi:hypothetical protein FVEG_10228 [Fusarium verticillioides 7600]|uniref:Uncharacterized protein n=1 Tax=Gibberella moniliformis (strain M3125 / FGSC 7600) TaxID=334819 RepID=W7MTT3_GIBM7|nr:hypothetical protein FVEG_10228 [Fusarium verticillioides 7600]EWG51149.1 hypothetical protein FVEG_10228 [Fusarium verticillioides 7600]
MLSCRPREALGLTGEKGLDRKRCNGRRHPGEDCGRRIYDYSSDRVEEESQS